MNINNSGKIPERIKRSALIAAMLAVFSVSGCNNSDTSSASVGYSAAESETRVPISEIGSSEVISSENPAGYSGAASSEDAASSGGTIISSAVISSAVSVSAPDFSAPSESSAIQSSAKPPDPVISSAAPPAVSSAITPPPVVSSSTPQPVVSVPISSEPEKPPAPVIVPTIEMPSSPGINYEASATGLIDYSNVSKGYFSARYTGSVSKIKVTIECNGEEYRYNLDPNGKTEYFPLSCGNGTYTVTVHENTQGTKYAKVVSATFSVNMNSALSPYLYPNQYCDYSSSSKCVYKAAELCAGKTSTIEKIAAIFQWISSNVTYDYNLADTVQSGYVPDPERTYTIRTGICFDYSSLMCAMLRSQSIPTRLVKGYAGSGFYHAWNEIYTTETGWITPEIMLKNAGYNLADSTIYSQNKNKQKAADFIQNSANYQAVTYH